MRHAPTVVRGCAAAALALLLAGCETMSEEQCRSADWLDRGRRDGAYGENEHHVEAHRKACAKAGVVPDVERWRAGWLEGVRVYCTPRSAWQRGLENRSYQGACRDLGEAEFLRWHHAGREVYRLRQQRDRNSTEIARLEEQLKKAQKDDERKALRDKIRDLDREQARLRRTAETLESVAPPR